MQTIKVTETERKILDAVKEAKRRGIEIVQGAWSVSYDTASQQFVCENNCCCPLGAVLLVEQPQLSPEIVTAEDFDGEDGDVLSQIASVTLGREPSWGEGFVEAYDDRYADVESVSQKAGRKIRKLLF